VISISFLSHYSPPSSSYLPSPIIKCIGYNFDESNVNGYDFSQLRYENGEQIPNVDEYLLKW
jgi:hypothetical protein